MFFELRLPRGIIGLCPGCGDEHVELFRDPVRSASWGCVTCVLYERWLRGEHRSYDRWQARLRFTYHRRQGDTPEQLAKITGWKLEVVRKRLGLDKRPAGRPLKVLQPIPIKLRPLRRPPLKHPYAPRKKVRLWSRR